MIQVRNISKSFGGQVLFENLSFNLPPKGKVGLVGRNGSGKSTIFRLIQGEESLDRGEISIPKNYKIGALKQHIDFTRPTVREECAQVLTGDAQYDFYKVEKILFGLGFTEDDLDKDPRSYSGGYQIRITLAKVLATEPDLLLLDEPTNYLDIVSLRWLQVFLKSFPGEVIIITHDQEFMDAVTTHTMGLYRKQLKLIKGDSAKFYEQLLQEEEIYEKTRLNHEKRKQEMEKFVERFRAKASKATQAQSKLKQLEKMQSMDELQAENSLEFSFNYKDNPAKTLMNVNDLSFAFKEGDPLFSHISFHLNKGERIGIIGKNGKGKSTLLNCLAGELTPQSGEVSFHPGVSLGHFGQTNISRLCDSNTIVQEITQEDPSLSFAKVRQICGTMMFPGELADKKISVLSGGEKSRVMLGKIIAKPSNLLFLDEPTNHLDMQSIESLCEAIEEFPGAVAIVTHSEMLLRRLVNKLIIFHEGGAEFFLGSYDDFLNKIGWESEEVVIKKEKPKLNKKELQKKRAEIIQERSKKLKPLKKEIDQLEELISHSERLINEKNELLVKASEENNAEAITALSVEVAKLENQIEESFERLEVIQLQHDKYSDEFEGQLSELQS